MTEETGQVVAVEIVHENEDLMLITADGVLIRIPVKGIPVTGRNTQGVRLIRVREDEFVSSVAKVVDEACNGRKRRTSYNRSGIKFDNEENSEMDWMRRN